MAIPANTVWEVRTTGSDANGGGFVAGTPTPPAVDYSQQPAAAVAFTDLVIGSTATQLTSAANPFTAAFVGNLLNITGGAGFTAGRYQVVSVTSGVATMDRAVGTAGSTAGTGNLGGCLATIPGLAAAMVAENQAFLQGGGATYTLTAGITFAVGGTLAQPLALIGYDQHRGDITPGVNAAGRPQVLCGTAAINLLTFNGGNVLARNLVLGTGTAIPNNGVFVNAGNSVIENCKVTGYGNYGLYNGGNGAILACEVTGGTSEYIYGIVTNPGSTVLGCYVHDGLGSGISAATSVVSGCVVANQSGAQADGIVFNSGGELRNNTVWNSGRHGINMVAYPWVTATVILGNVLSQNAGDGLANTSGTALPALPAWDGNAFDRNGLAPTSGFSDTTGVNGVAPYTPRRDVTLSASPFTNPAGGDFRLNANVGAGAACRGTAPIWGGFGTPTVAYLDMGAVQHQDSGGGGVSLGRLIGGV